MKETANREYTLADFEYELPAELIAQEPLPTRDQSRLMFVDRKAQTISHHQFKDIADLLKPGDVLVVNDTKVIPARLTARRSTGGIIEILLIKAEPHTLGVWQAMATPLKRLKPGEELFIDISTHTVGAGSPRPQGQQEITQNNELSIHVKDIIHTEQGEKRLLLSLGSQENVYKIFSLAGSAPLPPYIHRDKDGDDSGEAKQRQSDLNRYQTVFAETPGAVAAPTAGLHFSDQLLSKLTNRGIELCKVTLHVGPGTFKPITTTLQDHHIESEELSISESTATTINKALKEGRRVIAVGTTSCRALESAGKTGLLEPVQSDKTSLYISPGYDFKIIKGLTTNFHLSKSSLLVLVSAFAGYDLIMSAYKEAIDKRYRFFSYGDAMLIL
jgi:S-adenosylmethionine:tRNA ribosyltransferase-isomerase